jgi:YebC/PmpR family DNA-binding regulatory protein
MKESSLIPVILDSQAAASAEPFLSVSPLGYAGLMGAQWKQKNREESANAKGRMFTKLAKEIMVAARGGADPDMNPRLRMAVDAAKKASMTKDTLERAIKKGAGLLDEAVQYEVVTYEGFAPNQVPVIVECLTDNRNRTSANVRMLFRKGQFGASGSVSWDFNRLGQVEASPPSPGVDAEEAAIECGAQDLEPGDDGTTHFFTEPGDLDLVSKALTDRKWHVTSAQLIWKAKNPVTLEEAQRAEVEAFLNALDEDDDVQHLYVGLALAAPTEAAPSGRCQTEGHESCARVGKMAPPAPLDGLTSAEAARRLGSDGPNALPASPSDPLWRRVVRQFASPLIYILLVALVFDVATWANDGGHGLPLEGLVIGAVLLLNAGLGVFQEYRSEQAIAQLRAMAAPQAWVLRDGVFTHIPSLELVAGDVVRIASRGARRFGRRVGAHGRVGGGRKVGRRRDLQRHPDRAR